MSQLEPHLGGHGNKTHLDNGALTWLRERLNVKTYLDIGCGPGGMVQLANEMGIDALGIDGDHTLDRYDTSKFLIHDFTTGPIKLDKKFDLGWSVEFVEHVYEQYIPNYITAFQACKVFVMTYAPPGWEGHHHVNLQEEVYWINVMKQYGFTNNVELTNTLRSVSTMNQHKKKKAFVRNRGLVFINDN
jgi:SAM-dependent methyltransferase|tara:strand:+ start:430 stop:993 length:564 start_codon:yes stop_codon:yes gene_type:complete